MYQFQGRPYSEKLVTTMAYVTEIWLLTHETLWYGYGGNKLFVFALVCR
jgi:hypothetical protein